MDILAFVLDPICKETQGEHFLVEVPVWFLVKILLVMCETRACPSYVTVAMPTRGSLAKKKIMFLHSKNKASRKGYKGEC